jgi:anaerobic selenocysteine-containing dehydrogenase
LLKDEKTVPFLVVMDTHLTETAMMADMVLPAATYLEGWGVSSAPSLDNDPILNLRQPVVSMISAAKALRSPAFDVGKLLEPMFQPRGEAEEVGNVCLELARRIKGRIAKNLPYKNTHDYITSAISSIPGLKMEGGLKNLKSRGLWIDKASKSAGLAIPHYQSMNLYSCLKRKRMSLFSRPSNPIYGPKEPPTVNGQGRYSMRTACGLTKR